MICVDVKMRRCEDVKTYHRPPLLEEPFAQMLSGKTFEDLTSIVKLCVVSKSRVPDAPQGSGPYVEPSTGSLVLSEATPGDSGSYTCTGTNSAGSDSASTEIVIIRNRGRAS